jgi:hypothetical protein
LPRARKSPTSFRKSGWLAICYRKNRWMRGPATPDSCDWSSAWSQSSLRETARLVGS